MSGALYLRRFSAARQRVNGHTPDLFADNRFKIFGIRQALAKLGASPAVDLESLNIHELEQLRIEIAAQLSSRRRGTNAEKSTTQNL